MSSIAPSLENPSPLKAPGRTSGMVGLIGIIVSAVLIAALYSQLDRRAILATFTSANPWWLAVSIGSVVPITLLAALRFYWAAPSGSLPGYPEAIRLTMVAKTANTFLPSKSGDLLKSYFLAKRGHVSIGVALSIVVYERLCGLLGLLSWCLVGWLISPPLVGVISSSG